MTFAHGETVTVQTAGTIYDPRADDNVPDWSNPTEVTVTGVGVEPRPSSEPVEQARNAIVDGFTLYFPTGTAVGAHNRVVVRGGTYDVLGDAAEWRNPFTGWAPGLVVQVARISG